MVSKWYQYNLSNPFLVAIIVVSASCFYIRLFRPFWFGFFNSLQAEEAPLSKYVCKTFTNITLIRWIIWVIVRQLDIWQSLCHYGQQIVIKNERFKGMFLDIGAKCVHKFSEGALVDIFWPTKVFSVIFWCVDLVKFIK